MAKSSDDVNIEGSDLLASLTKHPLLNREEEQRVARQLKYCMNSAVVYRELITSISTQSAYANFLRDAQRENDSAIESLTLTLFYANIKWAIKLANKIRRLDFMDRFQYACIGLMKAIRKYDPDKTVDGENIRLSTYATYWIRQTMQRGAEKDEHTIRIPSHIHDMIRILGRKRESFLIENGREPTIEELHKESGISSTTIREIQERESPLSLDQHMDDAIDGENLTSDSFMIDPNQDVEETVLERDQREYTRMSIMRAIERMESIMYFDIRRRKMVHTYVRHGQVLRLRYRIGEHGDYECRTLEEVGALMQPRPVTRERVRQLHRIGVYWLRANCPELRELITGEEE